MTELANLEDLFKHMLQDMYYAENKIIKALPEMAKKATDPDLQAALEQHLEETKDQIFKLEHVFEICGYEKKREKCEAIEGLIEEGKSLIEESEEGAVRDLAMIAAAQKVEHYEIASYGTLCNIAQKLGHKDAAKLLHEILEQEKVTDQKLTKVCDGIEDQALEKAA
ncbi:MAG: hypothetical protein CO093_04940 [Alphaproteobacteria bacterium CG_4_9_14_3_um_filter_47_13]|nr:MAG: hypothetical protein CO093_04940 [Alphaproteobacteria bacterium CG_4_9_14_3_um_filter_47_13]